MRFHGKLTAFYSKPVRYPIFHPTKTLRDCLRADTRYVFTILIAKKRITFVANKNHHQLRFFMNRILWILRIVAAAILVQTLFFKFTAAPESVYIFTQLGIEPYGRIGSGIVELIAAVCLLIPRFNWLGAGLAMGTMAGAIFSHLGPLGIDVQGDGGLLFSLAVIVFICSAVLLFFDRKNIPFIGSKL